MEAQVPEDPTERQAWMATMYYSHIREQARQGAGGMWLSAWSLCQSINTRFHLGSQSSEYLERDMHHMWYTYCHAGMNIPEDSPEQDRLALQIIQLREQGLLVRDQTADAESRGLTRGTTADGDVWTDLPFMIPDMTKHWLDEHAGMSSAQRISFSKFIAKLAAAGAGRNDGLCGIALLTFREALETDRPLGISADQEQAEDPERHDADLTIAAYLPCVTVWLAWAGEKIIQLSEKKKALSNTEPGPLFRNANTASDTSIGFSAERWIFWLSRLESLSKSFQASGEDTLSVYATRMMDNMLNIVDGVGGQLKKDLAAAYSSGLVEYRVVPIRGVH